MPLILLVIAVILAGSLYTTGLEGVVDWLHRKLVRVIPEEQPNWLRKRVVGAVVPFSNASRRRLTVEAARFYREFGPVSALGTDVAAQTLTTEFVDMVFADVLWMEGKLAGSPLREPYDEYRAEGELRLGTALLLPLAACATCYATMLGWVWMSVVIATSIAIAIKLASYGLYYYRRAHSFAAHHIADGVLLAPCMETLKRNPQNISAVLDPAMTD
jgi:hypothetical protein